MQNRKLTALTPSTIIAVCITPRNVSGKPTPTRKIHETRLRFDHSACNRFFNRLRSPLRIAEVSPRHSRYTTPGFMVIIIPVVRPPSASSTVTGTLIPIIVTIVA